MSWTTASDLKLQLARRWDRGDVLRHLMTGEPSFPWRLPLKSPGSAELTERFDAVRTWVADLVAAPHCRIEWREVRHRVQGPQRLPQAVWIDTPDAALTLLAKRRDAERFAGMVDRARSSVPAVLPWLARSPLQAIELAGAWPHLLAVLRWLADHPRPGIYLRQVDIPGVHSKFIEAHRAVLSELLDLVLAPEAINAQRAGAGQFAARYGFLDKPHRIRFRLLDQRASLWPGPTFPDVTLDADSFACLDIPVRRVFITENEVNFLAFPLVRDAMVVFGAGYGWEAVARAQWLTRCEIHYWGDIDTHGFAILDQLRTRFEHAASFLMDRSTLMAHRELWGEEADQVMHDLPRLTETEQALFDELRDNRIRKGLRLEQERVGFERVMAAVAAVGNAPLQCNPAM